MDAGIAGEILGEGLAGDLLDAIALRQRGIELEAAVIVGEDQQAIGGQQG